MWKHHFSTSTKRLWAVIFLQYSGSRKRQGLPPRFWRCLRWLDLPSEELENTVAQFGTRKTRAERVGKTGEDVPISGHKKNGPANRQGRILIFLDCDKPELLFQNDKPLARRLPILIFEGQKIRAFRQMPNLQLALFACADFQFLGKGLSQKF